jgi:hypothetical protein
MNPEAVALLEGGALTLVNLMTADAWAQVRTRVARMLSNGQGRAEEMAMLERLDTSRDEVLAAQAEGDTEGLADIAGEWRRILRRSLAANPHLATELRKIIDEFGTAQPTGDSVVISGTFHGSAVQGKGAQHNSFTTGARQSEWQ